MKLSLPVWTSHPPLTVLGVCVLSLSMVLGGCASRPGTSAAVRPVVYPPAPEFYTVRPGDTVSKIAARYGLDYRQVAALNGLNEQYVIYVNQQLRLRGRPSGRLVATAPVVVRSQPPRIEPLPAAVAPASVVPARPAATPVTEPLPTASVLQWQWPVSLTVSERFDLTRKVRGLRFLGTAGTPVRAAASGEVVYASNGLPEYGNLLLIRHTDGYISAYAHLQQMLVSQGSRVEAGQQIALLGSSGTTQAMLEFQIRKNGKPLDPLLLLPKS